METQIKRLPEEIKNYIISYSYNVQPIELLEDIRNFVEKKLEIIIIFNNYWIIEFNGYEGEDIDWIENDLIRFINNDIPTGHHIDVDSISIFRRFFMIFSKSFENDDLENKIRYSFNMIRKTTRVNFFLGILTPKEREKFIKCYCSNIDLPLVIS